MLGALPRGKHVAALVSEYGAYYNCIMPAQQSNIMPSCLALLPTGAGIQQRSLVKWGDVQIAIKKQAEKETLPERTIEWTCKLGCIEKTNYFLEGVAKDLDVQTVVERVVIKVPSEPFLDFLDRAVQAGHPRCNAICLPSELQKVVEWNRDANAFD